ncbi:hypothetical protein QFC24_004188 [Naganishia onofrii]|uniref:Uncharacterized protein n=1 Tax=Naganishia onofrii TaxID=1851511 RepID=A0ACC2XG10_9TREE|nr:hypothetical protein QFC24_004188 [Naganishia onofrii]
MPFGQIRDVGLTAEDADASDSRLSDDLEGFLQLVPMPLQSADQKIINILYSRFTFIGQSGLTEKEIEFLLKRFQANNHVLSDERLKPIGHAILPTISRYCNHACLPHGVISGSWDPESKVIEVMAKLMKPLKAGEQLTIPYIDAVLPLQERQTFLQERYGFTCECTLCKFQESVSPAVLAHAGTATPEKLSGLFTTYVQKHVDALREICPYSFNSGFRPGEPFPKRSTPYLPGRVTLSNIGVDKLVCLQPDVIKELNLMFEESTADHRWIIARIQGQHILTIYGILYGWRFPLVGLHCLELAKVAFNLHVQCEEQPQQDVMHGKGASAAYLQEAAIYTIWAKENLACSTSMKGPRSAGSDQSIAEEILDMEHRCAAEWIT